MFYKNIIFYQEPCQVCPVQVGCTPAQALRVETTGERDSGVV